MNSRRQLALLFVWRVVIGVVGGGSLPLIPGYAAQLGAQAGLIGYYLAFGFSAIAASTFAAGWLSDRFGRNKSILISTSLVLVVTTGLLGQVGNLWQLVLVTALWFFAGGVGFTLIAILTSLLTSGADRGRVFGILEMAGSAGGLIAGLALGPIVDQWGYRTMFPVLAALACLLALSAVALKETPKSQVAPAVSSVNDERHILTRAAIILLASRLMASVAGFMAQAGTPLTMNALGLSATAVSLTGAVGGAVSLPLPLFTGWLSDRAGRKPLLIAMLLIGSVALLFLAGSVLDWHFWAVTSLVYIFQIAGRAVGTAYMADVVTPEALGRGLSLYGGMEWVGGIIGYGVTGYAIQTLGSGATFFMGAALPLLAALLLVPLRSRQTQAVTV